MQGSKKYITTTLMYIFFILIAVVVLFPLVWMCYTSLKSNAAIFQNPISLPNEIVFTNYFTAWVTGNFSQYVLNTVIITGTSIIALLVLTSLAAFGFTRRKFVGREGLFIFCIVGMMIGHQMYMINIYQIAQKLHLLNTYLGVILVYMGWTPFGIFVLRSFFNEIPAEIQNAARIDGCSEFQIYYRIMLPLARPALSTVGIFYFVWIWKDYIYPLLLLQNNNMNTVSVGLMNFQGRFNVDWGAQTAALTISTIFPVLIYYFFQQHFVRGLIKGSLSGE